MIYADRYRTLILDNFINQLDEEERENCFFQEDGATPHTAATTLHYLEQIFPGRVIMAF